ncbi:hypothetical protein LOAG_02531 [Loa loa]|uniref:Uncharacterized protein n=1 Tax=Loa loa TaxID=7209 RepID=A0A1S0U8F6_LOALO|nr:hypothetical protein LOAG_02531 [Loa loa]EFO25951.1 hypothetical protein LOAG_02531 [Loa loa]
MANHHGSFGLRASSNRIAPVHHAGLFVFLSVCYEGEDRQCCMGKPLKRIDNGRNANIRGP